MQAVPDNFDPNGVGNTSAGIFGLPTDIENASLVFIPVPWDVTVSNHEGTSRAPQMIMQQSAQIDLYDAFATDAWKLGMAMESVDAGIVQLNDECRAKATGYIHFLEQGAVITETSPWQEIIRQINSICSSMVSELEIKVNTYYAKGQIPFIVGGDHSVALGGIRAAAKKYPGMGVLQIDAHADLRMRYQGFEHSHASVMRNVLESAPLGKLIQVGIRELCYEENDYIKQNQEKISTWFDRDVHGLLFSGHSWQHVCNDIVYELPQNVYVTFDMDGLDPAFCPHTGTPVPGGLSYNQAMFLLETIVNSGRQVVGADLVETGAGVFDAMMACRVLFRLAGMMLKGV